MIKWTLEKEDEDEWFYKELESRTDILKRLEVYENDEMKKYCVAFLELGVTMVRNMII